MAAATPVCMYWFRKALRLHDNPALARAQQLAASSPHGKLLLVFVLDPVFLRPDVEAPSFAGTGIGRCSNIPLRFLCEALEELDTSLQKLNSSQGLLLLEGTPQDVLPRLWEHAKVTHLLFEAEEVEPYGKQRDETVSKEARRRGIQVQPSASHTLFPMSKYPPRRPGSYQTFLGEFSQLGPVPTPERAPLGLAAPPIAVSSARRAFEIVGVDPNEGAEMKDRVSAELAFPGGEKEALARLRRRVESNPRWVKRFSKPDSSPCQFRPGPSTTALSAYLTFGCLSARTFWHALDAAERAEPGPSTSPPESLKGQLLWREHFYLQAFFVGEPFDRMRGNPICRQIPWRTWEKGREAESEHFARFLAWKEGRTGHPFIDACMRQLVQMGWMHHLARHAVACFVTRGDLFIHWEHARDVFSEYLVDGDWSLNNANWMWLSCSSFFYQYFRVYGPESFPKKYDPNGDFVRHFVPELAKFPKEFIYAPWKAPLAVQQRCGCIIGKDYPKPLVPDHAKTSKENIDLIRAAYDAHAADVEVQVDTRRGNGGPAKAASSGSSKRVKAS